MARYGKTIDLIEKMFDKVNPYKNGGYDEITVNRQGNEVYKLVQSLNNGNEFKLFHYGTLTLHYVNGEIVYYYGESTSDRDSLNTLLDCLHYNHREYFKLNKKEKTVFLVNN